LTSAAPGTTAKAGTTTQTTHSEPPRRARCAGTTQTYLPTPHGMQKAATKTKNWSAGTPRSHSGYTLVSAGCSATWTTGLTGSQPTIARRMLTTKDAPTTIVNRGAMPTLILPRQQKPARFAGPSQTSQTGVTGMRATPTRRPLFLAGTLLSLSDLTQTKSAI
jgi:hypothetical protein